MADELDPVEQEFIAEVQEYVDEVRRAADEARGFADKAEEAKVAVDGMRDSAYGAGEGLGHVRDEALEAAEAEHELRDASAETAASLDLMGLSGGSTFASIGGLVGIMGALVVAIAAVAPAVASMGLGFAAFGAFAIPTVMQITAGLKDNAKQLAALPAPIRDVVANIKSLEGAWKAAAVAFRPEVLTAINEALSIAGDLMREIMPLAVQGAFAINGLLMSIKAGIDSSGFRQFLQMMTSFVVPATQAITRLAFAILGVLGNALETLMGDSIPFINFLTALVRALGGPLVTALNFVINLFMGVATAIEPLLPALSALATALITDVGTSFEQFIPILVQVIQILGTDLIKILSDLLPVFANLLTPNSGFMLALAQLPALLNAILPLFTDFANLFANPRVAQMAAMVITVVVAFRALMGILGLLRGAFIALTAVMEVNPIILIATAIALLVVAFIELWNHSAAFRNFWIGLWHDIQAAVAPVVSFVRAEIAQLTAWWDAHWSEIREVARVAWVLISTVVHVYMTLIATEVRVGMTILSAAWKVAWGLIRDIVKLAWDLIAGTVRIAVTTITGIIGVFLDIITGHWNKAWHDLISTVGTVLGQIAAQIGNFARDAWNLLYDAGRNIIMGLLHGMESVASSVISFVSNLGGEIAGAFGAILHIGSPSRVFYDHGRDTLLGYIQGLQAVAPQVRAALAAIGGQVAAGGLPGVTTAAGVAAAPAVHVNVPVTMQGTAQLYNTPQFLQFMQQVVQEAVLRYSLNNPSNGLALAGRL